jgi:hypothetical protein
MRTDVTNATDDDQFLAGFISGLSTDENTLRSELAKAVSDEARIVALSTGGVWTGKSLPSEASVVAARTLASQALKAATQSSTTIVSAATTELKNVYSHANSAIHASRCGKELPFASPFTTPVAA